MITWHFFKKKNSNYTRGLPCMRWLYQNWPKDKNYKRAKSFFEQNRNFFKLRGWKLYFNLHLKVLLCF